VPLNNRLPLLMAGHTAGKRSPVTCALKCANACAHPVPNPTDNPTFRDIAGAALSRRSLFKGAAAGAAIVLVGGELTGSIPSAAASAPKVPGFGGEGRSKGLYWNAIEPAPAEVDAFTVPEGYDWQTILRWGDPLFDEADVFDVNSQSADRQARQFGYNNDYLDILWIPGTGGKEALLVCNHEYVNPEIMFPPDVDPVEQRKIAMQAHGMSVVHLHRSGREQPWTYTVGSRYNRRITATTAFTLTGPAAGSELMKTGADPEGTTVFGTLGNCSGGTTPWGTVLSGEENFNGYFRATGTSPGEARYGLRDEESGYGFEAVDPRFDARTPDTVNEPNRFGWIVEIDPFDPASTPVKHTALGRLKHEGANILVGRSRHVAAYMGDDERFDYLYKFVSTDKMKGSWQHGFSSAQAVGSAEREHNKTLLSKGSLYVARFSGDSPAAEIDGTGTLPADGKFDGTGEWLPIILDGVCQVPGFTTEQALVDTRLAADALGATKMDRCEDVQPDQRTGRIYVACTNNSERGTPDNARTEGATEVNPRNENRDGHIVEITEARNDPRSTTFRWSLLLVCGDPATEGTYFAGFPKDQVSPISCPDNLAFDHWGNLWISTDGQPSALQLNDGLFKVPLRGPERGHVQQFLSVPRDAECTGPVIHDQDNLVFVAVQHPGEDGSFTEQLSYFPDYVADGETAAPGEWRGPRPSVVQVFAKS
jgi:secreted PhoX family phosphatase